MEGRVPRDFRQGESGTGHGRHWGPPPDPPPLRETQPSFSGTGSRKNTSKIRLNQLSLIHSTPRRSGPRLDPESTPEQDIRYFKGTTKCLFERAKSKPGGECRRPCCAMERLCFVWVPGKGHHHSVGLFLQLPHNFRIGLTFNVKERSFSRDKTRFLLFCRKYRTFSKELSVRLSELRERCRKAANALSPRKPRDDVMRCTVT